MLTIELRESARGLQIRALLKQPKNLRIYVRAAIRQAVSEYATGTLREANIRDRFGSSGMTRYGFRRRSMGYTRRQTRDLTLRGPAAFVSPRNVPWRKLASSLTSLAQSKSGASTLMMAAKVLRTLGTTSPHLRDIITQPGIGHTISVNTGATVTVGLTYPAARPLNANPQYGDELRDLTLGGGRDWRAIQHRAAELFGMMMDEIAAGRQVRAA